LTDSEAQVAIDEFFAAAGLRRVVSIDDMYGEQVEVADLINLVFAMDLEVATSVLAVVSALDLNTDDEDIRKERLRQFWGRLTVEQRKNVIDELRAKASPTDDTDLVAKRKFSQLFANHDFLGLSLREWERRRESILADPTPVLILVDEDFSKEGRSRTAGREVVREVLKNTDPEKVMCGLVSHNHQPGNVHDDREDLCTREHYDRSRFVLIPKALADEDVAGFASLLKLAVVAKPMDELRAHVTDILLASLGEAESNLKNVNIYDMEEIVFQSSIKEGIWEPETLVRVFNLFIRLEARKRVFCDAAVYALSGKIRRVSEVQTASPKQPAHKIWPIQHLESFDDSDIVTLRLPLAIGDIFERGKHKFILIFPPCDLAVRNNGQREGGIKEAILAEIVTLERKNASWELKHFVQEKRLFVDFKRTHSVKLAVLDLCVYNKDGTAQIVLTDDPTSGMVPSWQKRYGILQDDLRKLVAIYDRIAPSAQQREDVLRTVFKCSNEGIFVPTFRRDENKLFYDFKRISRLTQPRSYFLLQRYADFLTREALEQDFETPQPADEDVDSHGSDGESSRQPPPIKPAGAEPG
jgi:hypothetical protein